MAFKINPFSNRLDETGDGSGGGAGTITGDTGGALSQTSGNWNIVAGGNAGASVKFNGSTSTLSLNFADGQDNIFMGRVAGSGFGGPANVGVGTGTFQNIFSGQWNTAVGFVGLNKLSTGTQNTAIGYETLSQGTTFGGNTAIGSLCLKNCTGDYNVGVGWQVLQNLTSGTANTVIGHTSGFNYTGAESDNVLIKNNGTAGESGKIRIGNGDNNACFIAGITGVTVANSALTSCNSNGQLGTIAAGSAGQVLQSNGTSSPSFSTATYPSTAGTSGNVLTSNGTNWVSSAPGSGGLLTVTGTLTNAQIKAISATPIQAIAAPGAGSYIRLISVTMKLNYGGTNAFTNPGSGVLQLLYNSVSFAQAVMTFGQITGTNTTIIQNPSPAIALNSILVDNFALTFKNSSPTEYAGNAANNNTISYSIAYQIVTI